MTREEELEDRVKRLSQQIRDSVHEIRNALTPALALHKHLEDGAGQIVLESVKAAVAEVETLRKAADS